MDKTDLRDDRKWDERGEWHPAYRCLWGQQVVVTVVQLVFSSTRGRQRSCLKLTYTLSPWCLPSVTSLDALVLWCCWNCSHQTDHKEKSLALGFHKNRFSNPPEGWIRCKDASFDCHRLLRGAMTLDSLQVAIQSQALMVLWFLGESRTGTCLLCERLWEKAARALFHRKPHAAAVCPVSVRLAAANASRSGRSPLSCFVSQACQ